MRKQDTQNPQYRVMNVTDGIEASMSIFTDEEADQFIKDFPLRFERQGYYKTAEGKRINPNQVVLKKELITDPTNQERAAVAADTLSYYDDLKNAGDPSEFAETLSDLLTDLMHLADTKGESFFDIMATASNNYEAEKEQPKIMACLISRMPKRLGDPMPKVTVWFHGAPQTPVVLFEYYPDELSFTEAEFLGLTEAEARNLKFIKDKKYLQS